MKKTNRFGWLKKLVIMLLILGLAGFGIFLARNKIIKWGVEEFLSRQVGARLTMDEFHLNFAFGSLRIKNLKIHNPDGFSRALLLWLANADIKFDRFAIVQGKLYLSRADIDLKELLFETNEHGKKNIESLKIFADKNAKMPELRVDYLDLKINEVIEKGYRGKKPLVIGHDLALKKIYRNVNGFDQLALLLMIEPIKDAGIRGFKVLGLSALLGGPAAIPIAIAFNDMGRGIVHQDFSESAGLLFDLSLKVLDELGKVKKEDRVEYTVKAEVHGSKVSLSIKEMPDNKRQVTVSAQDLFRPQRPIASGVLYEINEELSMQSSK